MSPKGWCVASACQMLNGEVLVDNLLPKQFNLLLCPNSGKERGALKDHQSQPANNLCGNNAKQASV